ncbi:MAG TPA: hypothetical protein EYH03_03000 [Chromatiales bacterium]|nr:hypothetical protein [Chromatiales bacterium]
MRKALGNRCALRQFDMDTKRHKSTAYKKEAALKAKALIDSWKPDVVIAADDNAARYLIQPYFKGHTTPFVFCGVNWTVEEYGFPYHNVTGIVEVAPLQPLLERAISLSPNAKRVLYIGADTLTEHKNYSRFKDISSTLNIVVDKRLVKDLGAWIEAYGEGSQYDFLILGSNAGINDWNDQAALKAILSKSQKVSATNHKWMMPFSMLGLTKIPEEQGEWAGQVALEILNGAHPSEIPIVANRRWDLWLNAELLDAAGLSMPSGLLRKAKIYRGQQEK